MFGRSILVCPVTHPMLWEAGGKAVENPVTTRRVYLPEGNDWYDFYTMERFSGGQWMEVSLPLDRIPLFVKAGSILPMTESVQSTAESGKVPVQYRVFPGADAVFDLYDDSGDGYGCEKGEYRITRISWNEKEQKLTVTQ